MVPYFDRDGIVIYHADCRDVLPSIDPASVDLLLTDPPYGVNAGTSQGKQINAGVSLGVIEGDAAPFDPAHLLQYGKAIIFGAQNFASSLPDEGNWIVWDKVTRNGLNMRIAEAELAWTNVLGRTMVYRHMWSGAFRDSERGYSVHPTQKPVSLMAWIIDRWTKPGDLVLDPYMGSGPVAQACHELGRRYIGIELVEDYCKVAVSRLAQQTLDLDGGAA